MAWRKKFHWNIYLFGRGGLSPHVQSVSTSLMSRLVNSIIRQVLYRSMTLSLSQGCWYLFGCNRFGLEDMKTFRFRNWFVKFCMIKGSISSKLERTLRLRHSTALFRKLDFIISKSLEKPKINPQDFLKKDFEITFENMIFIFRKNVFQSYETTRRVGHKNRPPRSLRLTLHF